MTEATVGPHTLLLDDEPGDVITDVIVIARVQRADNPESSLIMATSEGLDYYTQRGMIVTAEELCWE